MANVWAPFKDDRIGSWADHQYASGWSDTLHFGTLGELNRAMDRRKLRGKVTRLGIVAHGDQPGVIALDRRLTRSSVASFEADFERMRWYLTTDATVTFYSCISGKATEGDVLLNAISARLKGRTVIGFITYGETQGGPNQTPGLVFVRLSALKEATRGEQNLQSPWHATAKWSRNGHIVRNSPAERQVGNRCANPACPGHVKQTDRCSGW